jgi:hypothetical protein
MSGRYVGLQPLQSRLLTAFGVTVKPASVARPPAVADAAAVTDSPAKTTAGTAISAEAERYLRRQKLTIHAPVAVIAQGKRRAPIQITEHCSTRPLSGDLRPTGQAIGDAG